MCIESPQPPFDGGKGAERLLAVTLSQGQILVEPGVVGTSLTGLTADLLSRIQPTRIVTPLFSGSVDATCVIERLEDLGYRGEITVIAPNLPRPALVQAELRAMGPGLRLVLVNGSKGSSSPLQTPRRAETSVQVFPRSR